MHPRFTRKLITKMISQKHALSLTLVIEGAPLPEDVEAVFSLEA